MNLITVDQERCIRCGLCVDVCPEYVFKLSDRGPEAVYPEECIACGHCVAVCPEEAIDHIRAPLSNQISANKFPRLKPDEAEHFLRTRRSIRAYEQTPVPREKLIALVNVAHFAQSGHNRQGISYVIADDRNVLDQAVELVMREYEKDNVSSHFRKHYREKGMDPILRGAPSLILATADLNFFRGRENSILSLAYLELYAPTLGLGSCWAGILEGLACRENSPLKELFHVPEHKKITGAVMVGYPKYTYPRIVDRNPLEVTFFNP